jgi:cation diffusion facilitator family transporter
MDPTHNHNAQSPVTPEQIRENWKLLLNTLIAIVVPIVLIVGGIWINSLVVLASAGHQALDGLFALSVLLAAFSPIKKATVEYTAGNGKKDFINSSTANTLLIGFELFAIYQALAEIATRHQYADPTWVYILEGSNLIANIFTGLLLRKEKNSLIQFLSLHNLGDAGKSACVIVAYFAMQHGITTWNGLNLEGITTIFVGTMICIASWKQKQKVDSLLIGKSPVDLYILSHEIRDIQNVLGVKKLHAWSLGIDRNAIAMSIGTSTISNNERLAIIVKVKQLLIAYHILPGDVIIEFHSVEIEQDHLPHFFDGTHDFRVQIYDPKEFPESGVYEITQCSKGKHFHGKLLSKNFAESNFELGNETDEPTVGKFLVESHIGHVHFREIIREKNLVA